MAMKNFWIICALLAMAGPLRAQAPAAKAVITSDEDYSKTMKDIGAQNGVLRKSLAAPSEADAAAAAARLVVLFRDIQVYWENKKVEDATTAAKNAVAASQAIAKAVAGHDMAAAAAGSQQLGSTCMTCHNAHRDRLTFDFYKIK